MGHGPRPQAAENPGDRQVFPGVPKVGHRFREALGHLLCYDGNSGQQKGGRCGEAAVPPQPRGHRAGRSCGAKSFPCSQLFPHGGLRSWALGP